MIDLAGHPDALELNLATGHGFDSGAMSGLRICGRSTCAFCRPASPSSCRILVVTGGLASGCVWPRDPTSAVKVGENGSAAQFVDVNEACPVAFWFGCAYESAVNLVVLTPQEVGFRMNPLPPTIPLRWMSIDVMSIGTLTAPLAAWATLGTLVSTVSSPKSLLRSFTSDSCVIFDRSGSGSDPVGLRTIPKRAGCPAAASTL